MKSVKQRDWSDCGVACLAAIASHYDLRLSVAHIRQLTGTDQSGTSIFGLVQASKQLRPRKALPLCSRAQNKEEPRYRYGPCDGAFLKISDSPVPTDVDCSAGADGTRNFFSAV